VLVGVRSHVIPRSRDQVEEGVQRRRVYQGSVLPCVAVCCRVLPCVAVCCRVLQCVEVLL